MCLVSEARAQSPLPARTTLSIQRPWLGVKLDVATTTGAGVARVLIGSPAEEAGLQPHDVIVALGGASVRSGSELKSRLRQHRVGATLELTVLRDGVRLAKSVVMAPTPTPERVMELQLLGRQGPDFEVRLLAGESTRLSNLGGKPVVLEFWSTTCFPCRGVAKTLSALQADVGTQASFLSVSEEPLAQLKSYSKKFPSTLLIGEDVAGVAHDAYFVSAHPTIVLLDAELDVAAVFIGADAAKRLGPKLRALLAASKAPSESGH